MLIEDAPDCRPVPQWDPGRFLPVQVTKATVYKGSSNSLPSYKLMVVLLVIVH